MATTAPTDNEVLTVEEAATILRISRNAAYEAVAIVSPARSDGR